MSDAALATVTQVHGLGMILIRADLDRAGDAIAEAAGVAVPGKLGFTTDGARWLGWMSPDELLLILPRADLQDALAALTSVLSTEHALVLDVSDMRCVFDLTGPAPGQVLAKLCPVDLDRLPGRTVRRTRAAQIACALWRQDDGWRIIAFRAITDYLRQVLEGAALPGTRLDPR